MRLHRSRRAALATLATISFATVGAGVASATTPPSEPTDTTMTSDTTGDSMAGDSMTETTMAGESAPASGPSGPLCAAVEDAGMAGADEMPTDTATATADTASADTASEGSATGDTSGDSGSTDAGGSSMGDSPVATAASMNPLLSTLVEAVGAAGLAETLDTGGPFTVLAPINSAFDKVPPAELEAALADPSGLLTGVLTYHVIPEQLSSADLEAGGTFVTLQGEEVSFEMRNDTLVVNGGAAAVQCADIATANATVFLIDSVLLPPSVSSEDATAATTGTDPATSSDTESTDAASTDATSMTTETTEA